MIFLDHGGPGHSACERFSSLNNEITFVLSFEIEMPGDYADDACLMMAELYSSASSI
jgi:hypothetical protein